MFFYGGIQIQENLSMLFTHDKYNKSFDNKSFDTKKCIVNKYKSNRLLLGLRQIGAEPRNNIHGPFLICNRN